MPVGTPWAPGSCAQAHGWWLWLKVISRRDCSLTLKPRGVAHFIPILLNPYFLYSPSSLRGAVRKPPPTHGRVHEPLGHTGDRAREHQPKYPPGMVQPWGSLQASPVHKAMILFMGTHGAWMLHGSEFNSTFNPLLDRAAAVVVWLFQWPNVLNFFIFTIVGPCRCQAGI